MVELRAEAQGLYKGLVYCSSIEESKHVKSYITSELKARTDLSPCISIKRGCTEFSNMYKDYGDIGSGVQVHQGKNQPYEWEKLEKDHLKAQKLIKDIPTLLEFNLGELLIIKNWIYYAQEMGDLSAIAKHCNTMWCNDDFKKQVTIKKETILTRGN